MPLDPSVIAADALMTLPGCRITLHP